MSSGHTKISESDAPPKVWHEDFVVHSYESGPTGFASPQALLRFIQEAAANHAASLKVSVQDLSARGQMWVLANLSLRMHRYPRWRQTLQITTWPVSTSSTARGYRDLSLRDEHGAEIGKASTLWMVLDKESRRLQKIPAGLAEVAGPGHDPEFLTPVKEQDFAGSPSVRQEFIIRGSDIDWNLHVNNVCYLEWALESLPPVLRLQNQISALDMSFVAEGKYGSSIVAECYEPSLAGKPYLHKIVDKETGKPLAMLRILWEPKVT